MLRTVTFRRMKHGLQLGSLKLSSKAILSPMESVSDVGFRSLCFKLGASLTWTEMIRGDALCRNNKATIDLVDTYDADTLTGIQLLIKSPEGLLSSLNKIDELANMEQYKHFNNIAAIDLNFGCPSPAVIAEGAGPALLKRRKRMADIFDVLVEWKNRSKLPLLGAVGCKIRLGLNQYEQEKKVYLPIIQAANDVGLDYVVVHARHAKQRSSDSPTWSAIGEIKCMSKLVPIIGNGNINSLSDANKIMNQTSCDGVMIARAAIRNPGVFTEFVRHDKDIAFDVINAQQDYFETAAKYGTKDKYIDFHKRNFSRLMAVNTIDDEQFTFPRNIHLT